MIYTPPSAMSFAEDAKRRFQSRIAVAAVYAFIPALCVAATWTAAPAFGTNWWTAFAVAQIALGFLAYAGNWSWIGAPLRYFFPAAQLVAAYRGAGWHGLALSAVAFAVFAGFPSLWARRVMAQLEAIPLALPFSGGVYYAGQAGASKMINHHHSLPSQQYAIDFVRLNLAGMRCRGFCPPQLDRYAIFGSAVTSPCDGEVTQVVDTFPDLLPPNADRKNPAGNYILIRIEDLQETYVLLAHLQRASTVVKIGERVCAGQPLARVGNSGNTSEPHLHIQIKRGGQPDSWNDGKGVPMRFGGRFLLRGDLVRAV